MGEPGEGGDHQRLCPGVQGGLENGCEGYRVVDRDILVDPVFRLLGAVL